MALTLEEIAKLPLAELEVAVLANIPSSYRVALGAEDLFWVAQILNEDGVELWWGENPDKRILLYSIYIQLMQLTGVKPTHPVWVRRSDQVTIPKGAGNLAHQTDLHIEEPDDLDPNEILNLYGLKKDSIR